MQSASSNDNAPSGFLPIDFDAHTTAAAFEEMKEAKVHANVHAYLRKKTSAGNVLETRNAGRVEFIMQKNHVASQPEPHVEWRVRSLKAFPVYDLGGPEFWAAT